ncbi:MAG: helix-turn-helix transcriptional regulator [Clostridia bacterium]|nr:helix-turn-helix transcriptional regulator [Clostridia bacterium]
MLNTLILSTEKLAQALGVTNQAVSKWESAQCCPDVMLIPEIANYFGVTTDELFGIASQINTERSVWVTELYDTGITAHLRDFSVEKIPAVQKRLKGKDMIVIEDHKIRRNKVTELLFFQSEILAP